MVNVEDTATMPDTREDASRLVNWGRFGSHPTDVIGYAYDADIYCPECAVLTFGANDGGWVPEEATDSEGNYVSPVFGDSEWWEPSIPECQRLVCADVQCGRGIDIVHAETCRENFGDDPCPVAVV